MTEEIRPHVMWLGALLAASMVSPVARGTMAASNKPHSRQKRLLWLTTDGRLALPPGTSLTITPSLALPFVRYPPDGFFSNMSISLPFTISFDKLGLTDNQNPYGVLPPILARSMGRSAGVMVADYLAKLINSRRGRSKRTADEPLEPPPGSVFHGGERAILYTVAEDFLSNFGMDGRACLLRAICEAHGHTLERLGMVGEIVKLFLTASKSPYAHVLQEYVEAEQTGMHDGECWKYYKDCPKSLFSGKQENKYRKEDVFHEDEDMNEISIQQQRAM